MLRRRAHLKESVESRPKLCRRLDRFKLSCLVLSATLRPTALTSDHVESMIAQLVRRYCSLQYLQIDPKYVRAFCRELVSIYIWRSLPYSYKLSKGFHFNLRLCVSQLSQRRQDGPSEKIPNFSHSRR